MGKKSVRLTFTEEVLGTSPNNPDIYREYIASKSPDAKTIEDEVASVGVDEVHEKGITVFPRPTSTTTRLRASLRIPAALFGA